MYFFRNCYCRGLTLLLWTGVCNSRNDDDGRTKTINKLRNILTFFQSVTRAKIWFYLYPFKYHPHSFALNCGERRMFCNATPSEQRGRERWKLSPSWLKWNCCAVLKYFQDICGKSERLAGWLIETKFTQ